MECSPVDFWLEEVCRRPELGVSMLLFTFVEFLGRKKNEKNALGNP